LRTAEVAMITSYAAWEPLDAAPTETATDLTSGSKLADHRTDPIDQRGHRTQRRPAREPPAKYTLAWTVSGCRVAGTP
jgi:hypothetical protein